MKIAFIRRAFLINNVEFRGSAVVEALVARNHSVEVFSAIVQETMGNRYVQELKIEVISGGHLANFDAVYVEGGYSSLQASASSEIFQFVRSGGILILADNDANGISSQEQLVQEYKHVFGGEPDGESWSPVTIDESFSLDEIYNTRFSTQNMDLVGFEKELVKGLGEIAVGSPLALRSSGANYLLTGTNLSSYLQGDLLVEPKVTRPWAILNHFGLGYAVLIGGRFTDRVTFNAVPGNTEWLQKVLTRLHDLVLLEKPTKMSISVGLIEKPWELEESQHHERKATAFKPLTTGDEKTVVQMMAKSIAALCNTNGGTLVIGQADDGTILGLEDDIEMKAKGSRDKYELAIRDTLRAKFGKPLEVIGVQLEFHLVEGKLIAVFTCPRPNTPVYTRGENGNTEHVYIRDGNRTAELSPKEFEAYLPRFKG